MEGLNWDLWDLWDLWDFQDDRGFWIVRWMLMCECAAMAYKR